MARGRLLLAGGALAAGIAWERTHPSACPYAQRWVLQLPRPGLSRIALHMALAPSAGQRILEIGPGTGFYSIPVAKWIRPAGRLDALDVQQEMLDATLAAAARENLSDTLFGTLGDATALPYEADSFDSAFLVTVLGEVPDQDAVLRELRRVVKPGGRVVCGETLLDPHAVTAGALRRRAEAAGLRYETKFGSALGFFAVLRS